MLNRRSAKSLIIAMLGIAVCSCQFVQDRQELIRKQYAEPAKKAALSNFEFRTKGTNDPNRVAEAECLKVGSILPFRECMDFLQPYVEKKYAEAEERVQETQRRNEALKASQVRKEEDEQKKSHTAISRAISQYIANGDVEAMNLACHDHDVRGVSECIEGAVGGRREVLRRRTATPKNCWEFGVYKGYDQLLGEGDVMSAGLQLVKTPGLFKGKVSKIEGKTLLIQNATTLQNAMVTIGGSQIFNGTSITVGATVVGYGVQSEIRQGRLVSGAQTSIPVISAQCVGNR